VTLISRDQRDAVEKLIQRLASSADTLITNKAEVKLVRNQSSEAKVRGFTLTQDEPASIAGGATGPTPTDYLIASVGMCENVIFVRNASLAGLSIDSLETSVSGVWDMKGLFDIDGVKPFFKTITVETRVTSMEPVEKLAEVARLTHRRCPIHATLSRASEMNFTLIVNGENIPL
jgi:uncharacterized OsmC-like protein